MSSDDSVFSLPLLEHFLNFAGAVVVLAIFDHFILSAWLESKNLKYSTAHCMHPSTHAEHACLFAVSCRPLRSHLFFDWSRASASGRHHAKPGLLAFWDACVPAHVRGCVQT